MLIRKPKEMETVQTGSPNPKLCNVPKGGKPFMNVSQNKKWVTVIFKSVNHDESDEGHIIQVRSSTAMGLQGLARARLLALLTPLASGKRDAEKFTSDIVDDGAPRRPPFRHSIGTIPRWPFIFMHSAHPSSYSANT